MDDRFNVGTIFSTADAAQFLGRQPQTFRKWRLSDVGPRYIRRMGHGKAARVGCRLSDLEARCAARTFESTSQETAALAGW